MHLTQNILGISIFHFICIILAQSEANGTAW